MRMQDYHQRQSVEKGKGTKVSGVEKAYIKRPNRFEALHLHLPFSAR